MSSNPYTELRESVRRWIDEFGWKDFTKIQAEAIPAILGGNGALLVAPTAGGKTEAALLPIVSAILTDASRPVSVLYIAPLRALTNDQANRAELLLHDTPLKFAWWHSDLSQSRRQAIARDLPDALMTTPESLEVHLSPGLYSAEAATAIELICAKGIVHSSLPSVDAILRECRRLLTQPFTYSVWARLHKGH